MATETRTLPNIAGAGPIRSTAGLLGYTLLRVVVGLIMLAHGVQKIEGLSAWEGNVAQLGFPVPELFARLAIAGELLGGAGLMVGLLTPVAAFGVLAVLVTAILGVHIEHGLFAQDGGYEYPLTLACAALMFMLNGAGALSLDAVFRSKRGAARPALALPHASVRAEPELPRPSGPVPSDGPVDPVTQAGMESFPASDPPAHSGRT
jgi:putative oxidoreductase